MYVNLISNEEKEELKYEKIKTYIKINKTK